MPVAWALLFPDTISGRKHSATVPVPLATCKENVININISWQNMYCAPLQTNVDVPMLAHAHKGHDTGVPLLKYRVKPMLQPKKTLPYRVLRIAVKLRIQQVAIHAHCPDLPSLCGGPRCMVALSDYEYDNCPAYLMNV